SGKNPSACLGGQDRAPIGTASARARAMRMKERLRCFWKNLKAAGAGFGEIDPFTQAGFLAYTTIFALPGVIILVIAIAGSFYDADQVEAAVYTQFGQFIGSDTTSQLERIVAKADKDHSSLLAKILGVAALVVSATTAFAALQRGLNKVWRVDPVKGKAVVRYLLARLLSLGMI